MDYSDYSRRYRTVSFSDAAPQGPALILARQECESSLDSGMKIDQFKLSINGNV
jgi:hypothetical protein